MKPGSDTQVSIPPALVTELQAAADEDHRSTGAVVQEALEIYLEGRRWRVHCEQALARARELGLPNDDVRLTGEYRQVLREKIGQGAKIPPGGESDLRRSLHGKNGLSELAELERQRL